MKNSLFWGLLNIRNKLSIFFRNKSISFFDWRSNVQQSRNLSKSIFIKLIKTFALGIILVFIFHRLDLLIYDSGVLKELKIDKSLFQNFLIGAIGVAGIFLGLYYSNISAIYSSIYINAPTTLRNLFQNDNLIRRNINSISSYMILGFVFIGSFYINTNIGFFTLLFWIVYSVIIVLTYSLSGNRSYDLTDSFILVNNIYYILDRSFKRVSSNKKVYLDDNVHYYLQRKATRQLSYINDIARFNIDTKKNKGPLVNDFITANFVVLKNYWVCKLEIPYSSKWYKDKQVYKKWYEADDSSISLALSTGTNLQSKVEQDFYWFEDEVIGINDRLFTIFMDEKDIEAILSYLHNLGTLSEHTAKLNELNYFVKQIKQVQNRLEKFVKNNPDLQKNGVSTANLVDALMSIHIGISIGVNQYLSKIDIRELLRYSSNLKNYRNADFTKSKFINNPEFKKLYEGIEAEMTIENTKITPDWYIEENLAKYIIREFHDILKTISKIYRELAFDLGVNLFDSKQHFLSSLVFTRMSELNAKNKIIFKELERQVNEFESLLGTESIKEINQEMNLTKEQIHEKERHVPGYLVKSTGLFTLYQENELNQYPDMLGYSYNVICEFLIDAIENNDIKRFENGYKHFLNIVILYEDSIRRDIPKEYYNKNTYAVGNVIMSPILEFSQISGYAYLWGEVSRNTKWKEIIEKDLESFLASKTDATEEILEKWISYLNFFQMRPPSIYNRDIIRQDWSTRMQRLLLDSDLLKFEDVRYGNTRLNTENLLLRSFLGNSPDYLLYNDPQDIYAIIFLNPKVDKSNEYSSRSNWEKRFKNGEIES